MSSLFGGSAPKPPPPVESIKKVGTPKGGTAEDRRRRAMAVMASRMPSRFGGLGSAAPGTTSLLGGG